MKKQYNVRLFILLATVALLLLTIGSVAAVKYGELDGEDHPQVVLILMDVDGEPAYRCSGTMIAPTYVLTAGHCAGAPVNLVE